MKFAQSYMLSLRGLHDVNDLNDLLTSVDHFMHGNVL